MGREVLVTLCYFLITKNKDKNIKRGFFTMKEKKLLKLLILVGVIGILVTAGCIGSKPSEKYIKEYETKYVCPNGKTVSDIKLCSTTTTSSTKITTTTVEVKKGNKFVADCYHGKSFSSSSMGVFRDYIIQKKFGKVLNCMNVEPITSEYLNKIGVTILILSDVSKTYDDQEIETIIDFVDNGGKLIVLSDSSPKAQINELIKNFGIRVDEGGDFGYPTEVGITSDNELFNGVISLSLACYNCYHGHGPRLLIDSPAIDLLNVACTSRECEDQNINYPIVAISQYGRGKVLVISNRDILDNINAHSGNRQFVYNLLTWLTSEDSRGGGVESL